MNKLELLSPDSLKCKGSWLVQRLQKPREAITLGGVEIKDNPFSFGGGYLNGGIPEAGMILIRKIFSFDYMGAAEFEFGAVPDALDFILNNKPVAGTM